MKIYDHKLFNWFKLPDSNGLWFFILSLSIFSLSSCMDSDHIPANEKELILLKAKGYFSEKPITPTNAYCERSAGGIHDFYSEGDYWWPDSLNPDGPYIRRDGLSNPGNFSDHRHAMVRLSQIIGTYAAAYVLSNDEQYVEQALLHLTAWFADTSTMMNPNMLYAQAIKGRVTGRGIGLIDAIHLAEVARGIKVMQSSKTMDETTAKKLKSWFADFLEWMTTHPYGLEEMNTKNNHATCWVLTAASFADLLEDQEKLDFCKNRFKEVLLPNQMAEDGSFPLELARTKPYGYSIFNIDAMFSVAQILSTQEDDLFQYATPSGVTLKKGIEFIYPFILDKEKWPYSHDVLYWDEWPVRQPSLFFAADAYDRKEYRELFYSLNPGPKNPEVLRNLPIRNPWIWEAF